MNVYATRMQFKKKYSETAKVMLMLMMLMLMMLMLMMMMMMMAMMLMVIKMTRALTIFGDCEQRCGSVREECDVSKTRRGHVRDVKKARGGD